MGIETTMVENTFYRSFSTSSDPLWSDSLKKGIWPKPTVVWVTAFYIAFFIIRPWENLFPELAAIRFERLMVVVAVGSTLSARGLGLKATLQDAYLVLLAFCVWISSLNAYDPVQSGDELVEFIGLVISYFIILKVPRTPYQLFFLIACYLVASAIYVFKAEWEYFINNAAKYEMGVKRLRGVDLTYGHPNTVGSAILCSLPFLLFFWRIRREFCQRWPSRFAKLFQWLLIAYAIAAIAGIFLTRSRSATLGLVPFGLLFIYRLPSMTQKLKWSMVGLAAIVAVMLFSPEDIKLRLQSTFDESVEKEHGMKGANASGEGRMEGFLAGVRTFQKFPLTGVGMGSFTAYREAKDDGVALQAHNLPGQLLGDLGLPGTLAFAAFAIAAFYNVCVLMKIGRTLYMDHGITIYHYLSIACCDSLLLLCYGGLAGHNAQRYNWYWVPAFALIATRFAKDLKSELSLVADGEVAEPEIVTT